MKKQSKKIGISRTLRKFLLKMKLTIAILFLCFLGVSASTYSQTTKLSIDYRGDNVVGLFQQIEEMSEFYFFYQREDLNEIQDVEIDVKNATIADILDDVFKNTAFEYKVVDRYIIVRKSGDKFGEGIVAASSQSQSQSVVRGKVTDSSGKPLPGVTIFLKGTSKGTVTDSDGNYSISDIPPKSTLVFSFVGMRTVEKAASGKTVINVEMIEEAIGLEEVVAIGYGSQSRSKISSSVAKVDAQVLEHSTFSRAESALQGTVPGVRVYNKSGRPGEAPQITLRGGTSLGGSDPLYIVDGVVRTLEGINPEDIESIQVLKDAASTAIYGARANNGVVLVKTKKGKVGSSKISYTVKEGVNAIRKDYNYLNTRDYIYYNRLAVKNTNEAYAAAGRAPLNVYNYMGFGGYNNKENQFDIRIINDETRPNFSSLINQGWEWMLDPFTNNSDTIAYKDHFGELEDAVFNNYVRTSDHHLSFSGANDKGSFFSSLGYYFQDGIITRTYYKRLTGTFKGSYQVKDYLKVFGEVTYSESQKPPQLMDEWRWFYSVRGAMPTWAPYDNEGNPNSGYNMVYGNPEYWFDKYIRKNKTKRTTFNLGTVWTIMPDLHLTIQGNNYQTGYVYETFNKEFRLQGNPNPNTTRGASAEYKEMAQNQLNAVFDYNKSFKGDHNFHAMIGGEMFDYSEFHLQAAGRFAPTDDIYTLNAVTDRTKATSDRTQYRIASAFARVEYDYKSKYLFTGVMRYDGISKLSEENRWGFFPGVSAAWNLHKESFFNNSNLSNVVGTIKPRISYGVNGNIAGLKDYEVQGLYGLQDLYQGSAGFLNTSVINKNLRWEKSSTIDLGLDLGLLDNRLSLIFDYYWRTTNDLLTDLKLPEYTGFEKVKTNLGSLQNKGFDLGLNVKILQNPNGLNWDLGMVTSYVTNKILKLPYNGNENNRQGGSQVYDPKSGKVIWVGGYQEGKSIGDVYAFQQIRILRDWDDVNSTVPNRYDKIAELYGPEAYAALSDKMGKYKIEPGDVLWADLDGNDEINSLDRVKVGNTIPKWTGGFSSHLSFKNVSLFARFDYALGHIIYNDLVAQTLGQYGGFPNMIDWVKKSWTADNPDTKFPKFYYQDFPKLNLKRSGLHYRNIDNHSSILYEKGDYLALRELTISYNVPLHVIQKIKLSGVRVNLTAENLAYFTKYSGTNPEYGGVDQGRYPMPKIFTLGIKADL